MSEQIIQVALPVTLCALYSCFIIRILAWDTASTESIFLDRTWRIFGINMEAIGGDGGAGDGSAMSLTGGIIIVLLLFCLMIIVTLLMLLVLYMGWHKCLVYYFYLPSLVIMALVSPTVSRGILRAFNVYVADFYTATLATWNFTALGMMAIFGVYAQTALCIQQFYLIHNASMMSLLIIYALPGWAPWLLLALLMIWDLFAVLAPYGPLNMIISLADHAGLTDMPGLIYSTEKSSESSKSQLATRSDVDNQDKLARGPSPERGVSSKRRASAEEVRVSSPQYAVNSITSDKTATLNLHNVDSPRQYDDRRDSHETIEDITSRTSSEAGRARKGDQSGQSEEGLDLVGESQIEHGLSIGLGDFIFYSLLIGLTLKGRDIDDFYTTLATLVAVLFGLVLTLTTLSLTKRALPALPISVGLGLMIAFLTSEFVAPLANGLASNAIFI